MKQVILTESQFHTLIESQVIIESIFEVSSVREFKQEVRKLIRRLLLTGMSAAAIISMINNYCEENHIPDETKKEVLSAVNDDMPEETNPMADWKLVDSKTIATVYNAVPAQCNGDFGHTASMFRLNLNDVLSQRVIAMERTYMQKLGLKYGDVVYIEGTNGYDGVWQIQDTMNKRFAGQHKIDILVPNNIKYGSWDNVNLYILKDKSLTDSYRSEMAPQISEKELRMQVAQKKQEFRNRKRSA